jgi:predicted porin
MKNWILTVALGTAVATTAIGLEANSASAVTITEVKATKLDILGNLFVLPGKTTKVSLRSKRSSRTPNHPRFSRSTRIWRLAVEGVCQAKEEEEEEKRC